MISWYIAIPMWFATLMNGQHSALAPDVFGYTTTKGGRYVTSSNAVNYYNFDTLIKVGWELRLEPLPIDSFQQQY